MAMVLPLMETSPTLDQIVYLKYALKDIRGFLFLKIIELLELYRSVNSTNVPEWGNVIGN